MMRAAEADLRKDIPVLSADKLIGASIDTFHKNPAHQRGILERLDKTIETDIKIGGHDFHLIVTPVFGGGKERIGTVVEWQDQTDIKAAEQVAFRLKSALDGCKTNVMVADDAYNIVYMNDTMLEMMRAAEADMRRDLPSLDVNKLIGTNIDTFHKNPAHQRRILDSLKSVTETDIKVGGRSFHLVVSPIVDKAGKRLGTTVEWKDETAEKVIEVEINNVVEAAVAGDLTQRVSPDGKTGFMLNLANSMNTLCGKVAEFVGGIKGAAQEVTNASAEISTSTTDLSQRTEEQAASLEETTASMEEIGATVKKNAENAQQANSSAINTREVADRGGEVVAKAVDAMARIEDSSGKISDIIGVIDEIARQTNLLALNAAVEAARAGDAGRGFAVVASEVRSLAQRSSQAAKDIKDLITNSGTQVKDGVELVNRAGAALTEIVESIKDVASIVSEIASASAEQATGIEQVNKALEQMDEVTQQNSALVEENAATAKTLEQQAMAMNEQVAFFRLGDEMGQSAVRANAVGTVSAKPRQAVPSVQKQAVKPKVVESPAGQQSASKQRGGPARRMQTNLAAAFQGDPQWKDF
jgi:methyl-accepting chemotaxis protein